MPTPDELIRGIHRSGRQCVLAITGGGTSAIGELLRVPGGSASVLEAVVPYSWPALVEWLGGPPDQACSAATARAMAMAAWQRARKLADAATATEHLIGIGCTASLASDRPKRGEHRVHIAFHCATMTEVFSLVLDKRRTRAEEEAVVCQLVIQRLLVGAAVTAALNDPSLRQSIPEYGSATIVHAQAANDGVWDLMHGTIDAVRVAPADGGDFAVSPRAQPLDTPRVVFPGAFHPRHDGHLAMASTAARKLGQAAYEISVENVDKLPLDHIAIAERLRQFRGDEEVWLTRAPTFVEKSRVFPNATFLVGADTIVRIGDPEYYGSDETARDAAISALRENGASFLVFGRAAEGEFKTIDDLSLPTALRELCDQVSEEEFRADVSSTEIRRQQEQQQQ